MFPHRSKLLVAFLLALSTATATSGQNGREKASADGPTPPAAEAPAADPGAGEAKEASGEKAADAGEEIAAMLKEIAAKLEEIEGQEGLDADLKTKIVDAYKQAQSALEKADAQSSLAAFISKACVGTPAEKVLHTTRQRSDDNGTAYLEALVKQYSAEIEQQTQDRLLEIFDMNIAKDKNTLEGISSMEAIAASILRNKNITAQDEWQCPDGRGLSYSSSSEFSLTATQLYQKVSKPLRRSASPRPSVTLRANSSAERPAAQVGSTIQAVLEK